MEPEQSFWGWMAEHTELILVGAIPAVISVIALTVALRSLKWARTSADAAARSANAAERANLLTERLLERENLIARPEDEAPDVAWQVENPDGGLYLLRNVGTATAEDVTMPPELLSGIPKHLPAGAIVRPGDAAEFYLFGRLGSPVPHTVYVTWRGRDDPQAVPVR